MRVWSKIRGILSTICFLSFAVGLGFDSDTLLGIWFVTYPIVAVWWLVKPPLKEEKENG